ncbi:sulfurtransferase TusA family protein [Terrabacter terrigena]|uniref:Sulfurtransferase TusA family protein n=1 Tax=Terrabacter terrigena TaxID=574718 RepID=A0ABW3MTT3_9MICO
MSRQGDPEPGSPSGRDERVVDARGERCPLPVIRLARLVRDEPRLHTVTVLATDPAAAHDIPAWCRMRGQRFVEARAEADHTAYVVELVRPSTPEAVR